MGKSNSEKTPFKGPAIVITTNRATLVKKEESLKDLDIKVTDVLVRLPFEQPADWDEDVCFDFEEHLSRILARDEYQAGMPLHKILETVAQSAFTAGQKVSGN